MLAEQAAGDDFLHERAHAVIVGRCAVHDGLERRLCGGGAGRAVRLLVELRGAPAGEPARFGGHEPPKLRE